MSNSKTPTDTIARIRYLQKLGYNSVEISKKVGASTKTVTTYWKRTKPRIMK